MGVSAAEWNVHTGEESPCQAVPIKGVGVPYLSPFPSSHCQNADVGHVDQVDRANGLGIVMIPFMQSLGTTSVFLFTTPLTRA